MLGQPCPSGGCPPPSRVPPASCPTLTPLAALLPCWLAGSDLSGNALSGGLPPALASWTSLRTLLLQNNALSGPIANLQACLLLTTM